MGVTFEWNEDGMRRLEEQYRTAWAEWCPTVKGKSAAEVRAAYSKFSNGGTLTDEGVAKLIRGERVDLRF